MGPGGVPVGAKTSEFYRTENVPNRFENPGLWPQNCIYILYINVIQNVGNTLIVSIPLKIMLK